MTSCFWLHHPLASPLSGQVHNQTVVDVRNALSPTLERGAVRQISAIVAILLTYTFMSAGIVYTIEVRGSGAFLRLCHRQGEAASVRSKCV